MTYEAGVYVNQGSLGAQSKEEKRESMTIQIGFGLQSEPAQCVFLGILTKGIQENYSTDHY